MISLSLISLWNLFGHISLYHLLKKITCTGPNLFSLVGTNATLSLILHNCSKTNYQLCKLYFAYYRINCLHVFYVEEMDMDEIYHL